MGVVVYPAIATFGGPLTIPGSITPTARRTFFFASYGAVRRNQTTSVRSTLPLSEFVTGNFARLPLTIFVWCGES